MGNKLRDKIINDIVKPQINNYVHPVKASIVNFDSITNKASIVFKNPFHSGMIQLFDVPVQLGAGGVHSAGPFPGDDVWVIFDQGDIKRPKVSSLADEHYETRTRETRTRHKRKGSFYPDSICERTGW